MRLAGFALLAAGLAFVFHAYDPGKFDRLAPAPSQPAIAVSVVADDSQPSPRARNFSIDAGVALQSLIEAEALRGKDPVLLPVATLPNAISAVPQTTGWTATVATEDSGDRSTLVKSIKRELRRVGCYDGRIDSEWDRTAREAMAAFVDHVNASLPYRDPDVVLLTLVRNHGAAACGAGCPSGQSRDGDGRCLPNAIVAMTTRKPATASERGDHVAMAPFTTVVVNEVRPTLATLPPPPKSSHASQHASRAPLPGRMAMGGPVTAREAPAEKSWWDTLIGGGSTGASEPAKEQTLDRPVGLTHVPQPRLVRQGTIAGKEIRQARLEPQRVANSSGIEGIVRAPALGDAGTQVAALTITTTPGKVQPARASGRKASRPRKERQRTERRWSGRNTQAMFTHPLGRM